MSGNKRKIDFFWAGGFSKRQFRGNVEPGNTRLRSSTETEVWLDFSNASALREYPTCGYPWALVSRNAPVMPAHSCGKRQDSPQLGCIGAGRPHEGLTLVINWIISSKYPTHFHSTSSEGGDNSGHIECFHRNNGISIPFPGGDV